MYVSPWHSIISPWHLIISPWHSIITNCARWFADLTTDVEDRVEEQWYSIMATEYLNGQLMARVEEMRSEVARRQEILKSIKEQRVDIIVNAKELKHLMNNYNP